MGLIAGLGHFIIMVFDFFFLYFWSIFIPDKDIEVIPTFNTDLYKKDK